MITAALAWSGYQEDLTTSTPAETATAIMSDPNNIRFKTQFGETYVIDEPNMVIWKDQGLLVRPAAYRKVLVERDIASVYVAADGALKAAMSNMIRAVNDLANVTQPISGPSTRPPFIGPITPRPTSHHRKRSQDLHNGTSTNSSLHDQDPHNATSTNSSLHGLTRHKRSNSSIYPLTWAHAAFAKVGNWSSNYWLTDGSSVMHILSFKGMCLDHPPLIPTKIKSLLQNTALAYLPVGGANSPVRNWFAVTVRPFTAPTGYCDHSHNSASSLTLLAVSIPSAGPNLVYLRAELSGPLYALTTHKGKNPFFVESIPTPQCEHCCWGTVAMGTYRASGDCSLASEPTPDICDGSGKCEQTTGGSYLIQNVEVPRFKYPSSESHVLLKKFSDTLKGKFTRSFLCSIPLISSVINSCGTADMSQLKSAVKTNTMQIVKNGKEIINLYKDEGRLAGDVQTVRSEIFSQAQESATVNMAQDKELDHLLSNGLKAEHAIILSTSALFAVKSYSDASTLFVEEFARAVLAQQLVKGRPGGQLTSASALTGIIPGSLYEAGLTFTEGELESFTEMSLWEKTTTITNVQIDPIKYKLQFELSVPLFDDSNIYRLQKPLPMCYTRGDFSFCGQDDIYRLESYNQNLHKYEIQYIESPVCTITSSSYLCPPGSLRRTMKPTVLKVNKPVPPYLNIDNKMVLIQDPSQITVTHLQNSQTKQIGTVHSTLYLLGCNSTITIKEGIETAIISSDNSGSNCPATTRSIKMGANIVKAITHDQQEFADVAAEVNDQLLEEENQFHSRISNLTSSIVKNRNRQLALDQTVDKKLKDLLNNTKEGVIRVGKDTKSFAAEQAVNEDWKDSLHNSTVTTVVVILYGSLIFVLLCCVIYLLRKDTGGRVGRIWDTKMPQSGYRNYGYHPGHAGKALGAGAAASMPLTSFALSFYQTEEWQYFTVSVTFLSFLVALFSFYSFFKRFHPVVTNRRVSPQFKYVCNWYIDIMVDDPENKKSKAKFVHICTTNYTPDVIGLVCTGKGLVLHCFYGNEHCWVHLPKDCSINAKFRPLYCQLHQSDKTKPSCWVRQGAIMFKEHESVHSKSIAESYIPQLRKIQRTYSSANEELITWIQMGMPNKESVLVTLKEGPVNASLIIKSINKVYEQMSAYLRALTNLNPKDPQLNSWKSEARDVVSEFAKELTENITANSLSLRELMGPQSALLMVASHFGFGEFSQGILSAPFPFLTAVVPGLLTPNIRVYIILLCSLCGVNAKMDDIAIASSFTLTHLFILFSYSTRMTCSVYLSSLCASIIPIAMLGIEVVLTLFFPQVVDADWPYDSFLRFIRTLMFTVMMWWVYRRSEHMKMKKTVVTAVSADGSTIGETRSAGNKHKVAAWIWVASLIMYFLTHIPNMLIITSSNTKQCVVKHSLSFGLPTCGHNGTGISLI